MAILSLSIFAVDMTVSKTVYVADGGTGDGTSASSPLGSIDTALTQIQNADGGEIVAVGAVTVDSLSLPETAGDLAIRAQGGI